ncbi:MAG: hypothetical protein H6Q55_2577 [Deltaproteobacteria bacterium]|jgi:hypothetical protein|nr:hypothetical protein [Deltaproteobacteria bacterium]
MHIAAVGTVSVVAKEACEAGRDREAVEVDTEEKHQGREQLIVRGGFIDGFERDTD